MSPNQSGHTAMNICSVRVASWENDSGALRAIREMVFIREQGVPPELEWDELDTSCLHLLAVDPAGNPVGTARLSPGGKIGRMAVLKECRGKGMGNMLMQRLLAEAQNMQIQQVALNAQMQATNFYKKFGFMVAGEEFMEAGIPHVRMVLQL
ncbi:MAG TPA: GNAT family N-acetyltransferase [Nitrosospira sp.]|nr:GNAT family N-acetyltransferase [Nitrosospira sp.]